MKVIDTLNQQLGKISERNWLIFRVLIFPIAILTPFLLSHQSRPTCSNFTYTDKFGHVIHGFGGGFPHQNPTYGILSMLVLILFFVAVSRTTRPRGYKAKVRFVRWQIVVSVLSIMVTIPLYILMRQHSQVFTMGGWSFDDKCHFYGRWQDATFGLGLAPDIVIILAAIYLLVPAFSYYRLFLSRNHVGDIKKKNLFQ